MAHNEARASPLLGSPLRGLRLTFKVTDVFAHLIKQTARFETGKNVAEQSRTKALSADCGFA